MTGYEHYYQSSVNDFTSELFFEDRINFYEMYNALIAADKAAPQLGLSESLKLLQQNYSDQVAYNNTYLEIQQSNTIERRQLEA